MTAKDGPTLRAQWLGARLKDLRESRKIKTTEAAEYLKRHPGTFSRFETGVYPIPTVDVLQLLDLYAVSDINERAELTQLSEEVAQRGWWDGYANYLGTRFADYVWLENQAHTTHRLDINAVPGLLQTPEYAAALIRNGPQRGDELQVKRLIEARLIRQRVLNDAHARRFRFLVHEAALHQRVGGPDVMREQLRKLREHTDTGTVELRILPLESWGHTAATVSGGFAVFELPEPYPDVAGTETMAGAIYVESPDIDSFTETYDALWADDALDSTATIQRIDALLKDL
ncbi:MAG: helix-turn-helix domain-containing protein [Stackebrandtia sp.]